VIVDEPADTPETKPDASTVALALLLVHAPPEGLLPNEVVAPAQTVGVPVIALGVVLTVTWMLEEHPFSV